MASLIQLETKENQADLLLGPELKEFIDRVIVPGLIKLYLLERDTKLDAKTTDVGESSRTTAAFQGQERP